MVLRPIVLFVLAAGIGGTALAAPDLRNQDLRSQKGFKGRELYCAQLTNANLSAMSLAEVDFGKALLKGANLSKADLRRADFGCSYLEGADLRQADLRGANLGGVHLLDRARLQGARYDAATRWPQGFSLSTSGAVSVKPAATERAEAGQK